MKKTLKNKLINGMRLFLVVATLISNFSFIPKVSAGDTTYGKGDVVKSTVKSNENELQPGEIGLEKSISKVEGTDDTYTVTLTATGEDIEVNQSSTAPIYAVVVFDNSDSMGEGFCLFTCEKGDKYINAMNGAIGFSESLTTNYKNSEVALVTFDAEADKSRDFSSEAFVAEDFPEIGNLTDIAEGIELATNMLVAKKTEAEKVGENVKLYMVVIGDGVPTVNEGLEITNANKAKDDYDIEIYSIGYDVSKGGDAEKTLISIATDSDHYERASIDNVTNTVTNITGSIRVPVKAGTDATITDVIADNFEYVENSACIDNVCTNLGNKVTLSNDKKTITFDVGDLGSATVSFQIKLTNRDLPEGEYPTNDEAAVDYTDPDGNNPAGPEIEITDSPVINWIPDEYSYTINYYKDEISEANKLGESLIGTKTLNAIVEVEENLRKPTGYNEITSNLDFTISKTESENIINVIYTKKNNLSYTINYYKDSVNTPSIGSEIQNNQTYGSEINKSDITPVIDLHKPSFGYKSGVIQTNMPLIIQDGENIIDVLYEKRDDFEYTVKYVNENGDSIIKDKVVNNVTYLEEVTEEAAIAPFGYVLNDDTTKTEVIDSENEVIVFNYKKRNDLSYTVKYLEQSTTNELADTKLVQNKTYLSVNKEEAQDIYGYDLVVDNNTNTNPRLITLTEDNMEVIFYYTKKTDFSYTVKYLDKDTNESVKPQKTVNNITYLTEVTENAEEAPYGYKLVDDNSKSIVVDGTDDVITFLYEKRNDFSYSVKYYEEGTTTEIADSKTVENRTYLNKYTEYAKTIPGYNVVTNQEQTNPREFILNTNGQEIIFYYTKKTNLSYTVNYYQDNLTSDVLGSTTTPNQVFESQITTNDILVDAYKPDFGYQSGKIETDMPYTIIDGENIINVCYYKRTDLSYTVKYVDETGNSLIEDKVVNNVTYLEEVTEEAEKAPFGYVLVSEDTKKEVIDSESEVIIFNYEKRADFKYTVKYLEKDTEKVLYPEAERTNKTYLETYKEEAVNITGYNVVVNDNETNPRFVTINEEDIEVIFYYTKKNDLSYTVNYYKDDITKKPIGATPVANQTFGTLINSEEVLVNAFKPEKGYQDGIIITDMPYEIQDGENTIQVCYYKKNDLTYRVEYYYDDVLDETKTEYYSGKTYEEVIDTYEDKVIEGYILVGDTAPLTIDDSDNNVIKVYYVSAGEGEVEYIEPPKTGVEVNYLEYISFLSLLAGVTLLVKSKKES